MQVKWKAITKGSFDELFKYYSDCEYINAKGVKENALTVDHMKFFYTQPLEFFKHYNNILVMT